MIYIGGSPFFLFAIFKQLLSIEEAQRLANDFLTEKDEKKQELYLRFFSERKFPLDYRPIFKIASRKNPKKLRLVYFALEALALFSENEIRQFTLNRLKSDKNSYDYLPLLISNYQTGDNKLLKEIAERSDNYNYIHAVGSGLIDIYKVNPTPECQEPLEIIYNKMNCSIHREDIVELLVKSNVLSEKLLSELQFDNSQVIRKRYKQIKSIKV